MNLAIDIYTSKFLADIVNSLKTCYATAFNRATSLFVNKVKRIGGTGTFVTPDSIQIMLANTIKTGKRNAENTKDMINLRYYVINNGSIVDADYAADSINLLDKQEMAQILNQEVETKGYVEVKPRSISSQENQLWIIGAVLGPLAFLCILFWLILFFYYKCINPRTNINSKTKPHVLKEYPSSVSLFS